MRRAFHRLRPVARGLGRGAALVAVAYSEVVAPVTEAFKSEEEVGVRTLAWLAIYGATVLRFFIGDILHLEHPDLTKAEAAARWFWDLSFIVLECVILIFAGSVTTLSASHESFVSFPDYLIVLYGVDVAWIVSARLLDWGGSSGRFPRLQPMVRGDDGLRLVWVVLDLISVGVTLGLGVVGHPASIPTWKLWALLGLNGTLVLADLGVMFNDLAAA